MTRCLYLIPVLLIFPVGCHPPSNPAGTSHRDSPANRESVKNPRLADPRFADQGSPQSNRDHAAKLLKTLESRRQTALEDLKQQIAAASSDEEKMQRYVDLDPVPEFVQQAVRLARSFPDTPAAFDAALAAFAWGKGPQRDEAMELMLACGSDRLNYRKVIESLLGEVPGPRIEDWFRQLAESAPAGPDQAAMLLACNTYFDRIPEYRLVLKHNPQVADRLPPEQLAYINARPSASQVALQEQCLQTLIDEYPDLRYNGQQIRHGNTYGDIARREMFELQNLSIGQVAPEIEGLDLDGAPFRLSDYRGKVVMLDFWGHWCPPCRRMYPHEQYLVRELTGLPFALVGVNSDRQLETAKQAVEEDRLPWRNFWIGPEGTSGPIARQWNVLEWPTIYLIDGDGVVRYKGIQGDDLNRGIETLMAEIGHPVELTESVEGR